MVFVKKILATKKPSNNILESLEKNYLQIAQEFGYKPVQAPVFLCLKKQDSQVSIEVEFGKENSILRSLENLVKVSSDINIFITSSNAKTLRLEEIRSLLLKKFQINQQKYYFCDIETHRKITANVEWEKFSSVANRPGWAIAGPMPNQPIFKKNKHK